MHRVVGVVRRRVAVGAVRLAEEQLLPAQLGVGSRSSGSSLPSSAELGRRREVEDLLELGHVLHLRAAVERVDALLGGQHRIAVEVGGALLELGEVFDARQRALRAEELLDVHAAQRGRVDAVAELLRADVADQVGAARWCGR